MIQVTMEVKGMHCGQCEAHVCDTIRKAYPEAKAVKASHGKNLARFRIDHEIDEEKLKSAVSEWGYTCESVSVVPYEKKGLFHRG